MDPVKNKCNGANAKVTQEPTFCQWQKEAVQTSQKIV